SDRPTYGYVPATNAIPQADGSGLINDGWLSSNIARFSDITDHAAVKTGVHGLTNVGGYTLTIPATGTAALREVAHTFTLAQTVTITDAQTATPVSTLVLSHALSSGSAAAGFGVDLPVNGHTTAGTNRNMALFRFTWVNAADASRTGRILFYVYDSVGAREAL